MFKTLLATVVRLAPNDRRGEVLASFFLVAYVGLALPVVALGILGEFVSPKVLMTVFGVAAAAGLSGALRGLRGAPSPVIAVAT